MWPMSSHESGPEKATTDVSESIETREAAGDGPGGSTRNEDLPPVAPPVGAVEAIPDSDSEVDSGIDDDPSRVQTGEESSSDGPRLSSTERFVYLVILACLPAVGWLLSGSSVPESHPVDLRTVWECSEALDGSVIEVTGTLREISAESGDLHYVIEDQSQNRVGVTAMASMVRALKDARVRARGMIKVTKDKGIQLECTSLIVEN